MLSPSATGSRCCPPILLTLRRRGASPPCTVDTLGLRMASRHHDISRWLSGLADLVGSPLGNAIRQPVQELGISIVGPQLESPFGPEEYRRVLEAMSRAGAQGLVVTDEPANYTYRQLIVELAAAARLPAVYWDRTFVEIGGLIAYGSSSAEVMRHVAGYIVRILTGTKPGDLPIYLEPKYELLINLKVAMSLGLAIPTSLLVRADEVIE